MKTAKSNYESIGRGASITIPFKHEQVSNTNLNFNWEIDRLKSFEGYQSTDCIITDELKANYSRAGFYWTRNKEEVKCAFCSFKMFRLLSDETDPVKIHRRYYSTCPLMSGEQTNNVPIDSTIMATFLPPKLSFVENQNLYGKYPEFQNYEERIKTFYNWPSTCVDKESLAKSGFFYLGYDDQVACYYCGLGLQSFEIGDVPREEHLKFRSCKFIDLCDP